MGRKKIDRNSLEYLVENLFHKDIITGFQFTAGRTPLAIKEQAPFGLSLSINKNRDSVVIDCSESETEMKMFQQIFPNREYQIYGNNEITPEEINSLAKQFQELGYEYETANFVGEWHWFRIHCKHDEILNHIQILKENIKL